MVAENFNIVKDDFLLSLADGKDLAFNAAEYIIAWESLEKAPTDDTLRTLKYSAEMIVKDDAQREKIASQDIATVNTQAGGAEGPCRSEERRGGQEGRSTWSRRAPE